MSKSIAAATDTSQREITHPTWCNPERCEEDRSGGVLRDIEHISTSSTWKGRGTLEIEVYATSFDNFDGESEDIAAEAYVVLDGAGPLTPAALFDLGAWLILKAMEYGCTPAGEANR